MRIKKFKKNEYIQTDGMWVRNLCLKNSPHIDINDLTSKEKNLLLNNELINLKFPKLDLDDFFYPYVVICSDGYDWDAKQEILSYFDYEKVKILTTNQSLARWKMVGSLSEIHRIINFYIVNNPYEDCIRYLPRNHTYFPNVLASTKTNPTFLSYYRGEIYFYKSASGIDYSGPPIDVSTTLDDYRNPICAAISFAWKLRSSKILLFCCDESFEDERPGAVKMDNGLYQYPQQILSQKIIDKQLFWLKMAGVEIFDFSKGIKYENAQYISDEEQLKSIFD